ncbi:hypothetical protein N665_0016s0006 [Sinapis alba]|nr:hypothetical protein N665_0016s0006 [Sinapis alba]
MVESTAENELLSFMDAFTDYNQIMMHPDDREKTSFITDQGTYCYRELLHGNKGFLWDEECEKAFTKLKQYLTTPPVLAKPDVADTLYLYDAVSLSAVSSVLNKEARGEQHLIFYTSKRLTDAETRYPTFERMALAVVTSARKLRPYFQSHSIVVLTDLPLRIILQNANQSGRLSKWAIELSEYDIS